MNQTVELTSSVSINNSWKAEKLKIIVFVQNQSTKEIYQSATINLNDLLTDIELDSNLPNKFVLHQNYPNPFNPSTTIKYTVANANFASNTITENENLQSVQLIVYDLLGKEVATLVNEQQSPSNYEVIFDASKLSSGIYYYQMSVGEFVETKKLVFLK